MTDRPDISIVIPTHNRRELLRTSLAALTLQSISAEQFEVIIVANGCTDGTQEMLRDYAAPFHLTVLDLPEAGAARSRNAGAAVARSDLLLFLDDDVEAAPNLVRTHLRAHSNTPNRVAIGFMPPLLEAGNDYLTAGSRLWWQEMFDEMEDPGHRFSFRNVVSGNLSLSANLFFRAGSLNAELACREDYELGVRLLKADAEFTFLPEAVGRHNDYPSLKAALARARMEGYADVQIGRLHPDVMPSLPFFKRVAARRSPSMPRMLTRLPRLVGLLERGIPSVLRFLERCRLRREWQILNVKWRSTWYWIGVCRAIGTPAEQSRLIAAGRDASQEGALVLDVDLSQGLARAQAVLDMLRPSGARLVLGAAEVGQIAAEPGAERLRGRHLPPLLARRFLDDLATAIVTERVCR